MAIEFRWGENQFDRLPALAADLVRRQVAVIVATGGAVTPLAAKAATTTIPIVFTSPEDPVRLGLVASLARPGGNVTGINFFSSELMAKRLELLRELVPAARRVAVLVNPTDANAESQLRDVDAAARAMGLQVQVVNTSTSQDLDAAFATFARSGLTRFSLAAVPCSSAVASSWFSWRHATDFPPHMGRGSMPKSAG